MSDIRETLVSFWSGRLEKLKLAVDNATNQLNVAAESSRMELEARAAAQARVELAEHKVTVAIIRRNELIDEIEHIEATLKLLGAG